jgi:hypothetical protein
MTAANARSLLALRPVNAVHRLEPRSEACPISLREIVRALEGRSGTLPIVAAPIAAVARGALLAAKEATAVVGLAIPPHSAPERWFAVVARAADELAPRLPFFVSAEVRVEDGDDGLERAFVAAHRLVEAGITHLAIDVSAVALARRAQAAAQVAGFAAEREIAIDAVLPVAGGAVDPESAIAFVEEFEGWGMRADVVSARLPPAGDAEVARAQLAALDALGTELGGRAVLRRGPLSPALAAGMAASSLRLCEDGGTALSAGLRAVPAELRSAAEGEQGRGEVALPDAVSDRLEALVYAEVATLLDQLGAAGTASRLAQVFASRV